MNFLYKIGFLLLCVINFWSCDRSSDNYENNDIKANLVEKDIANAKISSRSIQDREKDLLQAYGVVSTLKPGIYKVRKLQEISKEYYNLENYEKFKLSGDKALMLSKSLSDSLGMAKSYGYIGIYYRDKQLDSAYKNFYEADKIYRSLDESKSANGLDYAFDHGRALIDLAKLSRKVNDYSESEHLTIKAIEKFELSGDLTYLPLAYNHLGIVSKHLERYDDAINYHQQAIEYAKNTPKATLYAALANNNIGTVYKTMKEYEKAEEYYEKALSYENFLLKRPKRYARYLDNLAYVKFLSGIDNEETLDLFYKTLKIRDSVKDVVGISTNNLHLAEYYKSKGNDSLAKKYAIKVKEVAPVVNNNVELLGAYELLSEVTDSDEGLVYARKYIKLNDSLIKEERSYTNKFARIKFESDKKTEEIAAISRENQYLIFAILGLSILSLLGYVIFKQQQSNKELLFEQNQQQSNQEIYRLLLSQQLKLEEGRKLEQHRMSEELHDGVLGRLFGVRLSLDGINQRANDGFTDARNKYIDELKSIEREIRLISHDLGTETLSPDIAYVDVVESLVSDLCTVHKMDFAFANDENIDWETVDDQKKVNLFRIIQESLQNIFKHARAKSVKINFDYVDDKINLTILDDGIGFKSSKVKRGIGLKNITSRVTQMDGVVDFISNQDSGTKVSVGIPI
ncbi:tetratricopeptide repeat protein [uncultured Aquimarina sp.]|uniref:tetratricopeptide repeat protein n=1 Tax=uncultured Aquimarina sp. TaxID=575652 RepID=UPI00262DBAC0|nr:tetratricopeptide repeat protein [uncultured Aquimarina sp.]